MGGKFLIFGGGGVCVYEERNEIERGKKRRNYNDTWPWVEHFAIAIAMNEWVGAFAGKVAKLAQDK